MAWPLNLAEYAYNAEDVQRWMAGKTSGVYGAEGNWQVVSAGGMGLTVKATDQPGGWLSNMGRYGVVFWNGTDISLTVPTADGTLPRVDRVVVSWHIPQQSSVPVVEVRKGTPASNPVGPALVNDGEYAEICLAEIRLAAGQTEITADNIIDTRLNTELCGLVSAGLDKYPTDGLEAEFRAWFNALKTDLDGDVAANLLSNIETHKADTEVHLRRLEYAKSGTTHQLTGLTAVSGVVSCVFTATADFVAGDTMMLDGEAYSIQMSTGYEADSNMFVTGATIPVIVDKPNKKLNFKSGGGFKKTLMTEVITATTQWKVPIGTTSVTVKLFGAGGGGGTRYYYYGGNGGNMATGQFEMSPEQVIPITIGKGGAGGKSGGASSFGSYLSAAGGAGGTSTSGGRGAANGGASGGLSNQGSNGGKGGKDGVTPSRGTNTVGKGLEFEGTGAPGGNGVNGAKGTGKDAGAGGAGGIGGSGGYGGLGGDGGNGGDGGDPSAFPGGNGGNGGHGGGGGYGGQGGQGGRGGYGGSPDLRDEGGNGGNGGHGGGGGYGADGGNGGSGGWGGYGGPTYLGDGGDGGNGGGGGYGPHGTGGRGGSGGRGGNNDSGADGDKGGNGGYAAGGGTGGSGGEKGSPLDEYTDGSDGSPGRGGSGICILTYMGYEL